MRVLFTTFLTAVICLSLTAQSDILDMRENYNIGQVVTVTGIVTNGQEYGSVRYIQDEFAGVAVYPGSNWNDFDFEPVPGDVITVTGEITEFNGLLEIGPNITSVILEDSGVPLPAPQVVTPDQMNEDLEGELIQINACLFDNGGATIQGNNTYNFSSGGEQGIAYFRNGNPLVETILPISPVGIVGVLSQFTFDGTGGYQILPRNEDDFIQDSNINLTSAVDQTDLETTSFVLNWTTDVAGTSVVEYGLTSDLGSTLEITDETTVHEVILENLSPGTIYYAKVSSSDGTDTAESGVFPYATVSESSGDIHAYFTRSVNNDVATIEEAWSSGLGTNDTIAAYIDRAEYTIDCAIYNINDQTVVNALNDAYDRGVNIRYIAQGTNANIGLGQLNSNVPVWERMDDNGSGMHNKFMIIDADYTDQAVLLTGATNWTTQQMVDDFNNMIIFHDQSIARGYRLEFEEMWGSSDMMPNPAESKFSTDKTVNTPRKYIVGGSPVEVYFSPTDNTTQAIKEALLSANVNLEFALLAFTRDDLAEAVIDRNNDFFTYVRGIIEQTSGSGNEYEVLLAEGVEVYSHEGISDQIHHKYAIIDHADIDSDPIVVTGSHNWSSSAENVNDENTVIVHDARIANIFYQEFYARYQTFNSVEEIGIREIEVFPNPCDDVVYIPSKDYAGQNVNIEVYNLHGQLVSSGNMTASGLTEFNVSELAGGVYQLKLTAGTSIATAKLVVR